MSDCIINIRVFDFHFQVTRKWRPRITRNRYHRAEGWPDGYVSVYQFFN